MKIEDIKKGDLIKIKSEYNQVFTLKVLFVAVYDNEYSSITAEHVTTKHIQYAIPFNEVIEVIPA
jgi:hypothetical protein